MQRFLQKAQAALQSVLALDMLSCVCCLLLQAHLLMASGLRLVLFA